MTLLFLTPFLNGLILGIIVTVVGAFLIIRNNKASAANDIGKL